MDEPLAELLVDDQRGNCVEDITGISREDAEQIAAELAARYWPPNAAWLPCSSRPTRRTSDEHGIRGRPGRPLYGLLILVEDRMGPERARETHHFIEVDEHALAREEIAGVLGQVRAAITEQERDDMLTLARLMTVDDFVSDALESCPRARGRPV